MVIWAHTPRGGKRVVSVLRCASGGATLMAGALTLTPLPASADRLEDVLRQALQSNPTLAAANADVAVIGEGVAQAKAVGRPRASITATETEFAKQTVVSSLVADRSLRSDVAISIPLYRSGVVKYAVKDAEQRYGAARENLRATIANFFNSVVGAYSDVTRDEAIVRASERNVAALQANLHGIRGRFSIGDMTITDVALSEARLSLAEGSLRQARAQLITSRENYVRLVGLPAVDLAELDGFRGLPAQVEAAVDEALDSNGALQAARLTIDATTYRIRSTQGERGIRLSAFGGGSYFNNLNSVDSRSIFAPRNKGTAAQVGIGVELPLYQGGQPASRVRQARAEQGSAIEQAIALQRDIVAQTRSAYANWKLAEEYLVKAQDAIVANERALKGARMENAIGTRTLLDVLDIERELFNNYVTAAIVRRNLNVATFSLLALMGKADPEDLGLGNTAVARSLPPKGPRVSWSDWADGRSRYVTSSTSTAAIAVQNGDVTP